MSESLHNSAIPHLKHIYLCSFTIQKLPVRIAERSNEWRVLPCGNCLQILPHLHTKYLHNLLDRTTKHMIFELIWATCSLWNDQMNGGSFPVATVCRSYHIFTPKYLHNLLDRTTKHMIFELIWATCSHAFQRGRNIYSHEAAS